MFRPVKSDLSNVHCRTGSLENAEVVLACFGFVHCRTGSLERAGPQNSGIHPVHCRTGSLES